MIIQCDHCSARFKIDDSKLVNGPVKVRCAKCKEIFVVQPAEPVAESGVASLPTSAPPAAESDAAEEFSFNTPPDTNTSASADVAATSSYSEKSTEVDEAASESADSSNEFDWKDGAVSEPDDSSGVPDFNLSSFDASLAASGEAAGSESTVVVDNDFDFGDVELSTKSESSLVAGSEDADDFSMDFGEVSFSSQADDKGGSPDAFSESSDEDVTVFSDFSPPSAEPSSTDDFLLSFDSDAVQPAPSAANHKETLGITKFSEFSFGAKAEPVELKTTVSDPDLQSQPKELAALDFSEGEFDEELPPSSLTSRKKSGALFPLFVIVGAILLIIAIAGSGVYFFSGPKAFSKIGLGFLVGLSGDKGAEEGRIVLKGVTASYAVNGTAGELFVVRGEAVNNFDKPRASIQIKVSLLGTGGVNLVTKSAYCGNSLSDEQLATLPLEKIEEIQNNQFGDSLANLGLKPGGTIPFVVVVSPLPKDSTDFSVVVGGSTIATQ